MSDAKTILITGATSGIGLSVAEYLSEKSYRLLLVGRDVQKLREVSEKLNGQSTIACDLSDLERISGIFDYCKENSIRLDGMVHCAGCVSYTPIRSINLERDDIQMQVHYYAFLQLYKYFSSKKYSNDGASVIAISSLASITKNNGTVMYSASKAALNVAVSVAAKEGVKRKIRVNAILPANVDTRMAAGISDWIDVDKTQPFGLIPSREIAYLSEFLLSDQSKYITGALIPVSAGMEA